MSSFDFVQAADTANMQAGGSSFFGDVGDALTKGVGAALVSGVHGLYNTGVDLKNFAFDTNTERADTAEALTSIDRNWGQYYEEHKGAIDAAGFVAGSLLPGTLAIKGLKAVQTGSSYGAFGRVLGFTTRMENKYLDKALTELATEGGTIFNRINASKLTSMAWGVADNVLQAAAFEVAAAAAMKSSPMLDKEEWGDILWDIGKTSLAGGAIGGGINALFTNRIMKDAGKSLVAKQREYDVLANVGDINLTFGDKAFSIIDAIEALPKEILDPVVKLTHGKKGIMQSLPESLTKALLSNTLRKTLMEGETKLQAALIIAVPNDLSVGTALSKSLVNMFKQGVEEGQSPAVIRQVMADKLLNLHTVEGIGSRPLDVSGELRFLDPKGDVTKLGGQIFSSTKLKNPQAQLLEELEQAAAKFRETDKSFESYFRPGAGQDTDRGVARLLEKHREKLAPELYAKLHTLNVKDLETGEMLNAFTDSVRGGHIGQLRDLTDEISIGKAKPVYRVVGSEADAKMATLGKEAMSGDEAFQKGFDFVFDPQSKTVSVNPNSAIYRKIDESEALFAPVFFNTLTKQTSLTAVPTIADIATVFKPLDVNAGGVIAGNKAFSFSTSTLPNIVDSVQATARHVWAENLIKIGGDIDIKDIALLDALLKDAGKAELGTLKIVDRTNGTSTFFRDISNFEHFVYKQKFDGAVDLLEKLGPAADLRDVAYRLNVSGDWLETAVSTKFSAAETFKNRGWIQDAARYKERENLIFRYDTAAVKKGAAFDSDAIVAYNQRVKEATQKAQDASASVLKPDHYKLLLTVKQSLAADADSQTVGAGLLSSSNAGYTDKLRSWAQYTGQQVATIVNERVTDVLSVLQTPAAKLLSNPTAAAEVGAAVTQARLSADSMAIWTDKLTGNKMLVDLKSYKNIMAGGKIEFEKRIPLSADAGAFLQTHHDLHIIRIEQQKVLAASQGTPLRWDSDKLYLPPVDTQRVPFFAFVRQADGTVFGSSEVSMITAKDAAGLQKLASEVEKDPTLMVIYKANNETYHKAKGDYDFARAMNDPVLDSTLRKNGKLGDYLPNLTPQAVVEDFVQYTQRAETKLVRDAVSVNYAQTIAELEDLSKRYIAPQTSKFEGLSQLLQRNVTDPFGDAIKLALNVSKQGEFTLWHQANEFVDAMGTKAWRGISAAVLDARGGKISWQEAEAQLEKFGIGKHFTDEAAFQVAQTAPDRNLIKVALQKANMLLANGMLRLDFANSLLNIVSTPILLSTEVSSIRNSMKSDPVLREIFEGLISETVPGTAIKIPSTTRMLFNAVADSVSDPKKLMTRFREIGTVKGQTALFHQMIDDLSLVPNMVPSKYSATVDNWLEKAGKFTGSDYAEDTTRYVTSHVMWQMTEPAVLAGKMTVQEQNAYISIFTNRVQGNYIASQRPIMFQGTLGSAVGLFQTYQFNLFQQLFRHIENKNLKTIAVMGGMQATLFGLNGLPLFDAINTQLVGNASINEKHADAYSYAVQAAGKPIGDWLMYGTTSAFPLFSEQSPALWTRGDLNPRSAFILPVSPMDVPAVQGSLKVISALLNMGKQIGGGGDASDALLHGLEHNGLNRPLAGLAQVLKGNVTTNKGDLISASSDWLSIATASRLLGAKPMDESIARTQMYRSSAYQAVDKMRVDSLGTVIKNRMRSGEEITSEDWMEFQGKYAAAGGRIQGFTQAVQRWDKAANVSVINSLMRHTQTAGGQRMIEVMGGDPLQDYRNMVPE